MLKVYLINLDRSPDRLAFMDKQLKAFSIPYERVQAVDGKKLSENEINEKVDGQRLAEWPDLLTRGAIGCALSHQDCYRRIAEGADEYAVILEDDIKITAEFPIVLNSLSEKLTPDEIFLLYFHSNDVRKFSSRDARPVTAKHTLYRALSAYGVYAAGCYVMSRKTARRMLDYTLPIHSPSDNYGKFYTDGAIGGLWALLPLVLKPGYFGTDIGYGGRISTIIQRLEALPFGWLQRVLRDVRGFFLKDIQRYEIVDHEPELRKTAENVE